MKRVYVMVFDMHKRRLKRIYDQARVGKPYHYYDKCTDFSGLEDRLKVIFN